MRLGVRAQLLGSSAILLVLMAAVGAVAYVNLGGVAGGSSAMYDNSVVSMTRLDAIAQAVIDEGRLVNKGIVQIGNTAQQSQIDEAIAADEKTIADSLAAYGATQLSAEEQLALSDFRTAYTQYGQLRDATREATRNGDLKGAVDASNQASAARTTMQQDIDSVIKLTGSEAQRLDQANDSAASIASMLLLGGLALAILVGLGLSFFIARRITRGVTAVQDHLESMRGEIGTFSGCLARLAENDLSADFDAHLQPLRYSSSDEIGRVAALSNELLKELNAMADSYETARASMTATLGEVKDAAGGVARTSAELTNAAHQSGTASTQIAQTINQVAAGAQDQAQAASATSAAVAQLTSVIERVGSGAADTTEKASDSRSRLRFCEASLAFFSTSPRTIASTRV